MSPRPLIVTAAAAAATLLAASALSSPAQAQVFGLRLPGGYSVDGRKGPYLRQIDPTRINQAMTSEGSLAFAREAGNRGGDRNLRIRMPETEAMIAALIAEQDRAWPHARTRTVSVIVVASGYFAPEALPDGSIQVPIGLLAQVDSDDEAAYLFAHELSHVRLGHFGDEAAFRQKRQLASRLGAAYISAAAMSQTRVNLDGQGQIQVRNEDLAGVQDSTRRATGANNALKTLLTVFIAPAWSRGQEDEADALGYDLSSLAGYNALAGADSAFRHMTADFDLKTETAARLRRETARLAGQATSEQSLTQVRNGDASALGQQLWRGFRGALGDQAQSLLEGHFGQTHRPPDQRRQGLSRYADAAFPDAPLMDEPRQTWLTAVRGLAEYQEAERTVIALGEADRLQAAGQFPEAVAALQPALALSFRDTPAVLNSAAALFGGNGDVDEADRLYSAAHDHPDEYLDAFVDHAALMVRHNRYDRAQAVIVRGKAHYLASLPQGATGSNDDAEKAFLPSLIEIAFGQGDTEQGMARLNRCVAYEEQALSEACSFAAFAPANFDALDEEQKFRIMAATRERSRDQSVQAGVGGLLGGLIRLPGQ